MGKTSKWFRSFLTGKKDHNKVVKDQKEKIHQTEFTTIPGTPKEKRRWSFRRSSATGPTSVFNNRDLPVDEKPSPSSSLPPLPPQPPVPILVPQQQTIVVGVVENEDNVADIVQMDFMIEEIAAVKIQACFRSHLARKALRALRGLVKLQALVRGHLVRKQATATLRCMQALITLQAKAREQRIRMIEDSTKSPNPRSSIHKTKNINTYQDNERSRFEENIKIVEMDIQSREYYKNPSQFGSHYSPAPSAITEMSPRAYSGHFEDYNSFTTAQSSPQCFRLKEYCNGDSMSSYDYPLFPNYMANTQSSKAKARSQSAPKQRPAEVYERQPSGKRRSSMEAPRNGVPRAGRMQRSSSQLAPSAAKENQYHQQNYHNQYYPWMAIKLDRSNISLMESECGSTSTVMTSRPTAAVPAATNGYGNMY